MKKTININLGGYALTIDDDAYSYLENYLENIKRRFYNSEGRDEILSDIEARMGELLTTNIGSRAVVAISDVEGVVDIMGKPEEYGDDPVDMGTGAAAGAGSSSHRAVRTGRRLYRDEEDATVGGVCSGLAAYFGFEDPLWMRLGFVLLTVFSGGFWIVAYVLLWALVPPALNASDRLAMKGEAINVDNIAREVEQGFDRFGNKVSEFGESVKKKSGGTGNGLVRFVSRIVEILGKVFGLVIRLFAKLFKGVGVLAAVALLFALAMLWIASAWLGFFSHDFVGYFSPLSKGLTWLGFSNALFLVGIPIIALLLLFSRIFFKYRPSTVVTASLIVLWVVNFSSAATLGAKAAGGYSSEAAIEESYTLNTNSDILYVDLVDDDFSDKRKYKRRKVGIHGDGFHLMDDRLLFENNVDIEFIPSDGNQYVLEQIINSRGATGDDAETHARSIQYEFLEEGNRLLLHDYYTIPKGSKFRDQQIDLVVHVPIGRKIQVNERAKRRVRNTDYSDAQSDATLNRFPNEPFTMSSEGLSCTNCPKWGQSSYKNYTNYENFTFEGNLDIEIVRSNKPWVKVEGSEAAKNSLQKYSNRSELTLSSNEDFPLESMKISIGTRDVNDVKTKNNSRVTLRGFDNYRTTLSALDQSQIIATIDCEHIEIRTQNSGQITLNGEGSTIEIESNDQSMVDASNFFANRAEVKARNQSSVKVYAEAWIEQQKSDESNIDVRGDAGKKEDK